MAGEGNYTIKDFLHQVSHHITTSAEVVQVEDVYLKGWQRMWGRKTSDLAPGCRFTASLTQGFTESLTHPGSVVN